MNLRSVVGKAPLLLAWVWLPTWIGGLGGCVRVESGTDPGPLGYGPGAAAGLGNGYDVDPVPRPAPTPWTPPASNFGFTPSSEPVASAEPVAYNDDILRVCEHLAKLGLGEPVGDRCHALHRVERVFRTIAEWKSFATCLEATSDSAGVGACEKATPRMFGPVTDHLRESGVCMHIFALTVIEQLGAEPMLDVERIAEFEPLQADCVNSLVTEEREDRNPTEYGQMLECIEISRTTAAAEACE